ncbi:MAG: hypothetical protein ACFCGT_16865 [Sandaracinaceae bacterium]
MMRASAIATCLLGVVLSACGPGPAADLEIERLPEVNPNLPSVPTLPEPPFPVTYDDNSYSVYGVRRRAATTMDSAVSLTGYVVDVYRAPPCEEGQTCPPPAAPHVYIADTPEDPEDHDQRILVAGYAENQTEVDEIMELHERGRYEQPDPESGQPPFPVDFVLGAKVKVEGRFTRVSGAGFNASNGLLEYRGYELIEPPPEDEG